MFLAASQFPKNLGSLMSCLDTLAPAKRQKFRDSFLNLFAEGHSKNSILNYSYVVMIHNLNASLKTYFMVEKGWSG